MLNEKIIVKITDENPQFQQIDYDEIYFAQDYEGNDLEFFSVAEARKEIVQNYAFKNKNMYVILVTQNFEMV